MATKEEWVAIVKAEHPTIKKMVNGVTSEEPRISVAFNINTIEGSTRRVFSPN